MKRIKILVNMGILMGVIMLCTACAKEDVGKDTVPDVPQAERSYTCKEIKSPDVDLLNNCTYLKSTDSNSCYMVIDGTMGDTLGLISNYHMNRYQEDNWEKEDLLLGENVKSFYQDKISGIMYAYTSVVEPDYETGQDGECTASVWKISDGKKVEEIPVETIDSLEKKEWLGVRDSQFSMFFDVETNTLFEYDLKSKAVSQKWENMPIKGSCMIEDEMFAIGAKDVAEVKQFYEGQKEVESAVVSGIKKPLAIDGAVDQLFILSSEGIWQCPKDNIESAEKIFDCEKCSIDFEHLLDFKVVGEEGEYAFYLSSLDDSNGKYVINEIRK